jgi:hypothetical protein
MGQEELGRRPYAALGDSTGDRQMLEYTPDQPFMIDSVARQAVLKTEMMRLDQNAAVPCYVSPATY